MLTSTEEFLTFKNLMNPFSELQADYPFEALRSLRKGKDGKRYLTEESLDCICLILDVFATVASIGLLLNPEEMSRVKDAKTSFSSESKMCLKIILLKKGLAEEEIRELLQSLKTGYLTDVDTLNIYRLMKLVGMAPSYIEEIKRLNNDFNMTDTTKSDGPDDENLTERFSFRVNKKMAGILEEKAAQDRRKTSDTIRLLLERALEIEL